MRTGGIKRLLALALAASAVSLTLAAGKPVQNRSVPQQVCGRDREILVPGAFVRNDFWGEPQCLTVDPTVPGFTVVTSTSAHRGGVVAFPYIGYGWAWGAHSPGTVFPRRLSRAGRPLVAWQTTHNPPGTYNRALDMWFSHKPIKTGQATAGEIMVWISARGYHGSPLYRSPVVRIDGQRWHFDWWMTNPKTHGGKSWPLMIFARVKMRKGTKGLSVRQFADYVVHRHIMSPNAYWESILAGFERQSGGKGLRTTKFSVTHVS
jgi:hypothetical protein